MARLGSPQDYLFLSWDVQLRTFTATCCYRSLNVIERAVTHTALAFFWRRTHTSSVLHALGAYVSRSFHVKIFSLLFYDIFSSNLKFNNGAYRNTREDEIRICVENMAKKEHKEEIIKGK